MNMLSSSNKLRQKRALKEYLKELSTLAGRFVYADELSSLEQVILMREKAQQSETKESIFTETLFLDRNSKRFKEFVEKLTIANSSSIYVWTPRTIDCGALLLPSLSAIKFDFDFTLNKEGILAFATSDLVDSLLLDFYISPMGDQRLKIETKGKNWGRIDF